MVPADGAEDAYKGCWYTFLSRKIQRCAGRFNTLATLVASMATAAFRCAKPAKYFGQFVCEHNWQANKFAVVFN